MRQRDDDIADGRLLQCRHCSIALCLTRSPSWNRGKMWTFACVHRQPAKWEINKVDLRPFLQWILLFRFLIRLEAEIRDCVNCQPDRWSISPTTTTTNQSEWKWRREKSLSLPTVESMCRAQDECTVLRIIYHKITERLLFVIFLYFLLFFFHSFIHSFLTKQFILFEIDFCTVRPKWLLNCWP